MKKKSKSFRNIAIIISIFVFATLALMSNLSNQTSGNFISDNPVQSSFNLGIVIIILIVVIGIFVYYLEKFSGKIVKHLSSSKH